MRPQHYHKAQELKLCNVPLSSVLPVRYLSSSFYGTTL